MKKQIIATTLLATMALTVGYANKADVKVATHEGNVVEAKADYVSPIDTSDYTQLPVVYGRYAEAAGPRYIFDKYTDEETSNFTNSLKENVYSFKRKGNNYPDMQMKTYMDNTYGSEEVASITVYSNSVPMGKGNMIGKSFDYVKNSIKYAPLRQGNDWLQYECAGGTIEYSGSNGKVTSVSLFFK